MLFLFYQLFYVLFPIKNIMATDTDEQLIGVVE